MLLFKLIVLSVFYLKGMDRLATEGNSSSETDSKGPRNLDQMQMPGLRHSMSVSDFIGHIEHCLSEEMISGNPSFSDRISEYQEMLDDISQHLLNDNQATEASSDEKSLMTRVNSLRSLLQKDPAAVQNPHGKASAVEGPEDGGNIQGGSHDHESMQDNRIEIDVKAADEDLGDVSGGKQAPGMTRKDSFAELLFNLPRIASLPKFLYNISEEDR